MHYPVWTYCCKRPNYDFCISQGSVATVLKRGGQNYSHLRQVSLWCFKAGGTGPVSLAMAGPTFWQNYKIFVSTRHISGPQNFRSLLVEGFWCAEICLECVGGRGSVPDPGGGAHDAPPDSLVGWGGDTPSQVPLPSRLQRSMLGTFGASFLAYTHVYF